MFLKIENSPLNWSFFFLCWICFFFFNLRVTNVIVGRLRENKSVLFYLYFSSSSPPPPPFLPPYSSPPPPLPLPPPLSTPLHQAFFCMFMFHTHLLKIMLYYNTSFVKNKREREKSTISICVEKRPLKRGKRIIHTQKEMNKKKWTKENQSSRGRERYRRGRGKGGEGEGDRRGIIIVCILYCYFKIQEM